MIRNLSENFAEINIQDGPYALIEFSELDSHATEGSLTTIGDDANKSTYMSWGGKDDLPLQREWLIEKNNIVPALLKTRRDISVGQGIEAYKKHYENDTVRRELIPMPAQIEDFFERSDIVQVLSHFHREMYVHSNAFIEGIMTKDRKKVYSIQVKRCRDIRAGEMNSKGMIPYYLFSKEFGRNRRETNRVEPKRIDAFSYTANKYPTKWIKHITDDTLYDEYYPVPTWWGGRKWIELANIIPEFHIANLRHGYTLRYHIEIPKDYFSQDPSAKTTPESKKEAQKKEQEAKSQFLDRLNEFLSGVKNAGRAMVTYYDVNPALQKEFPGIKITPLKTDIQDEALLKLFEKSNQANISGQSIHPTLANIETQGKLSSGSEIRNAYLMYLAIHTTYTRRLFLRFLHEIGKINKWPKDIYLAFQDIEMTRLDDDKSGSTPVVND